MKLTLCRKMRAIVGVLSMILTVSTAEAAHYVFSQGGYSGSLSLNGKKLIHFTGGKISGSFDAEDTLDEYGNPGSDGLIYGVNDMPNEIYNFSLKFSGNPHFDSFFSLDSIPEDGRYLLYDIKNKILKIDLYWEGSYLADHTYSITGDSYDDFLSFTYLNMNLDNSPSKLLSGLVYAQGIDKQGNEIDGGRDLNIDMASSEPAEVKITHAPLPGALGLFVGAVSVLGLMRFKKFC